MATISGVKLVKKFRTLEMAIEETLPSWPKCANCGKRMRPTTDERVIPTEYADGSREPPLKILTDRGDVFGNIPREPPASVLAIFAQSFYGRPVRYLAHVWTGGFNGYGRCDGKAIFCTLTCGEQFGAAAYRAGYRLKTNPLS